LKRFGIVYNLHDFIKPGDGIIIYIKKEIVKRRERPSRFIPREVLTLPLDYNYYIQSFIYSFIYNNITPSLAEFLHNRGFSFEKRSFKMFTFSKLHGRYRIHNGTISFFPPVELIISSLLDRFVKELANSMLKK